MTYIDGFVAAVPTANKQKFIDHAKKGVGMAAGPAMGRVSTRASPT